MKGQASCCMQSSGGSGWTDSRTGHRRHGVNTAEHVAFPSGLAHKQPHFGKRQRGLPLAFCSSGRGPSDDIRHPYSLPSKTKKGELRVSREGGPRASCEGRCLSSEQAGAAAITGGCCTREAVRPLRAVIALSN